MIWHEQVSSIATAAGSKLGYLFRTRKYFSPSNLLTLYKAHTRPSLEYCSHIWGAAAPTILSILDAVQRRAIRLIGDPALTCCLQPLSHRRPVGDLSLFYRYSNGFCSSKLTAIIPPLSKPARCTRGNFFFSPQGGRFFIHQGLNDTTALLSSGCPGPGMDCLVLVEPASVGLFKSRVNNLPLSLNLEVLYFDVCFF
nr:unnamed protein product [Callosobruchus chinensis]